MQVTSPRQPLLAEAWDLTGPKQDKGSQSRILLTHLELIYPNSVFSRREPLQGMGEKGVLQSTSERAANQIPSQVTDSSPVPTHCVPTVGQTHLTQNPTPFSQKPGFTTLQVTSARQGQVDRGSESKPLMDSRTGVFNSTTYLPSLDWRSQTGTECGETVS